VTVGNQIFYAAQEFATPGLTLTPTRTITPTPTSTPAPTSEMVCVGDCDGDGSVTINELITMVYSALNGVVTPTSCPAESQWCSDTGPPEINCIIIAVNNALYGCPVSQTPTPSPTPGVEGACMYVVDSCADATGPTAGLSTRSSCCEWAATSDAPGQFVWCAAENFDPVTRHCSSCINACVAAPCNFQADCVSGLLCINQRCCPCCPAQAPGTCLPTPIP
jgi:hypothetical protein